jgi:hypothetical protein
MIGYKKLADVTATELDPNTTAPAADRIFRPTNRRDGRDLPRGIAFFVEFVAGAAPTVTYTIWLKDEFSGKWITSGVSVAADAGRIHRTLLDIPTADVFFQVTAIAGAPTSLSHRVALL